MRAYATLVCLVFFLSSPSLGVFIVHVFADIPFYRGCAPTDATAPGGACRFALAAWQKYAVAVLAVVANASSPVSTRVPALSRLSRCGRG